MSIAAQNPAVVSPELVLVAPPDVAAAAREALPPYPPFPPVAVPAARRVRNVRDVAFATFLAVCVLGTFGPLALAIVLTR